MSERSPKPPELPEEREYPNPVTTPPPYEEVDGGPPGDGTWPGYATEVVNVDDDDS